MAKSPEQWTAELTKRVKRRLWIEDNQVCAVCGEDMAERPAAEIVVDGRNRLAHQDCVTIEELA